MPRSTRCAVERETVTDTQQVEVTECVNTAALEGFSEVTLERHFKDADMKASLRFAHFDQRLKRT